MKKNDNVIIINGRHYDAGTGEAISHAAEPAPAVKAGPAEHKTAIRKPANHAAVHTPKPPRTLMRQAVKKPAPGLKRHIKVQGHLGSLAAPAQSRLISRASSGQASRQAVRHPAVKDRGGQLISHFSPHLFATVGHAPSRQTASPPAEPAHADTRPVPKPLKPRTTAELLEYAIRQADGPEPLLPARNHHRKLFKRHVHAAVARS